MCARTFGSFQILLVSTHTYTLTPGECLFNLVGIPMAIELALSV